jgi:hypothetical protein
LRWTCRIKKERKQQELDELAFNVLASFRQHGAMQWVEWHETTRARRGERGLGTTTFSDAVKRLMAEGRVQIDGDGCYRVVAYDTAVENERSSRGLLEDRNGNADIVDIADIALQQLLNREIRDL